MDKKNKNSILNILILGVLAFIVLLGGSILKDSIFNKNVESKVNNDDVMVEEVIAKSQYVDVVKQYSDINSDVVGVIELSGTPINYPILYAENNDFYLNRDINKQTNKNGSIFLDCLNESDFSDVNTVIYGHSMKDKSMFGSLEAFRNQEFTDANSIIKVYANNKLLKYKIFSVYVIEPDYQYRVKKFENNEEIQVFLDNITSKSEITSDIKPTVDDKILTLSTCAYDFEDARLAVHAVLIDE